MSRPVLWHIPISHYSEKVRWALALKGVDHRRREAPGGAHMGMALALTRGSQKTFPVLQLNGTTIGDSTAIIAELERRWPEPPLYPEDPADRERALVLEDWFDENLGPDARLLGWHEATQDRELMEEMTDKLVPAPLRRFTRLSATGAKAFLSLRYRVASEERAEQARRGVVAALDRLEEELGDGEYLVGGRFGIADLTAASLFYPVVLPPEGPDFVPRVPEPLECFRAPLRQRPGYRWVEEMFRRHRYASLPS